jgi:hypothetical protein
LVASVSKLNGRSTSVAGSSFITSTKTSSADAAAARDRSGACTRSSVPGRAGAETARRRVMFGVIRANAGSMPFHATAK